MDKGAAEMSGEMIEAEVDRLTSEIQRLAKDRDEWRAEATRLTNAGTGLIIQLNVALADVERLTEERDAAQADLKQAEENNHGLMTELQNMRAGLEVATEERDSWQQRAELAEHEKQKTADAERRAWLNYDCAERLKVERDAARADLKQAEANNHGLMTELQNMRAGLELADDLLRKAQSDVARLTAERDAAEREKQLTWENLQRMIRKCDAVILERDVSRDENYRLREERNNLHKENEGLRADALAYPPQRLDLQQYVTLKADYDRQVIMIETLQEGLKRTETMLAKAQAEHIDDRLKGFLAVISQLADQAQDLLP